MAKAAAKRDRQSEAAETASPRPPEDIEDERGLASFHDIPINVSVQLDHKLVSVGEVLDLKVDSIVKLERSAGENVDLLLDNLIAGNGEIVVIEDMMGLRITDLAVGGKKAGSK